MKKIILENKNHKITFLDHGATIYEWIVKSKKRNIVLTNQNIEDYQSKLNSFLGGTIGRVANRIKYGQFKIDDIKYQLKPNFDQDRNFIHGGDNGFWNQKFNLVTQTKNQITFKYKEKDFEAGFPGDLTLYVTYLLKNNGLTIGYTGLTSKKTPLNVTNHTYFNLSGESNILNHLLQFNSDFYLETDQEKNVTGKKIATCHTILDFKEKKLLNEVLLDNDLNKNDNIGIDHCFILTEKDINLESSDLLLKITTSYPAVQIYTLGFPSNQLIKPNQKMNKFQGIAIECQYESDAINHPNFSNIIFDENQVYSHFIKYEIITK